MRSIPLAAAFALAATAYHARAGASSKGRELIVGHGVLGRLLARLRVLEGGEPPIVWETNPARRNGASGYHVIAPEEDQIRAYSTIYDVSGDSDILDLLLQHVNLAAPIIRPIEPWKVNRKRRVVTPPRRHDRRIRGRPRTRSLPAPRKQRGAAGPRRRLPRGPGATARRPGVCLAWRGGC